MAFFLALLFSGLLVCEVSFLWTWNNWIAAIPLLTIAGILVMQRIGIVEGAAWFFVLGIIRLDIISIVIAFIGPVLLVKLFSARSLYALLGLGLVAFGFGIVTLGVTHELVTWLKDSTVWKMSYSTLFVQEVLLVPGLFCGSNLVRWFERTIWSRIALKPLS
jgi:hypothetical protein